MAATFSISPDSLDDEQKARYAEHLGQSAPPELMPKPESEVMRLRRQLASGDGAEQLGQAQRADRLVDSTNGVLDALYSANTGGMGKAAPRPKSTFTEDALAQRGMQQQRVKDLEGVDDNDPGSEQSKSDQAFIAQVAPGLAQQTAGMSSTQIRRAYPMLKEVMDSQQRIAAQKAAFEKEQRQRTLHEQDVQEQRDWQEGQNKLSRQTQLDAAGKKAAVDGPKLTAAQEAELRRELMGSQTTKDAQQVATAFKKLRSASQNPNAAGDLSLIYSYMRMQDPNSSVREGEFASAENAKGVEDAVRAKYNKLISGERLTPEQRQQFVGLAQKLYQEHVGSYKQLAKQFHGVALRGGLNPENVVLDLGFEDANEPSGEMSAKDKAALDWANKHQDDPRAAAILKLHGGGP